MKRATYHHHDLAEALVKAAERLVADKGVAGFSLREAAREVGVDPAACYRHFRDKQAIVQEIGRRGFIRLAAKMEGALRKARSTRTQIVAIGRAYVEFALASPSSFKAMFGPSGLVVGDPRMQDAYAGGRSPYRILEHVVRELDPPDLDTATLMLWSGAHGFASLLVDGAIVLSRAEREQKLEIMFATLADAVR